LSKPQEDISFNHIKNIEEQEIWKWINYERCWDASWGQDSVMWQFIISETESNIYAQKNVWNL